MSETSLPDSGHEITFPKQKISQQSYQSSLSLRTSFQPPVVNSDDKLIDEQNYAKQQQASILESDALALNALKKISLGHNTNNTVDQDNIDLSTFASLTRQPRLDPKPDHVETSILNNLTSVSSGMAHTASTESDGLTLTPMRRDDAANNGSSNNSNNTTNKRAMSQYEGRRPVSPSPILRGELLDLPLKPQEVPNGDVVLNTEEFVAEPQPALNKEMDNIRISPPQVDDRKPEQQQFKPATLLTTPSESLISSLRPPLSQPLTTSFSESHQQHQPTLLSQFQSAPNISTRDEERYKDPQSINRLKRPLYVPAVLRPNLANNYSDMTSSNSSLNSENNEISKDLQRYKEYNNVGFISSGRGGGSPLAAGQLMAPSISQQSSIASSPGQQQQNIIGKFLDKFIVNKSSSSSTSSTSPPPTHQQQQQQQQQHLQPLQQQLLQHQHQHQQLQLQQQQLIPQLQLLQLQFILQQQQQQGSSDASSIFSTASSNNDMGPTREHWKLDTVLLRCSNCNKIFTNLGKIRRKHHCRSCGDIFCTNCINHYIYLDKDAQFVLIDTHPKGKQKQIKDFKLNQPVNKGVEKYLSKVCYHCFENYENLLRQNNPSIFHLQVLKKPTTLEEEEEEEEEEEDLGYNLQNGSLGEIEVKAAGTSGSDRGANLPADWNWSSF